MASIPKYQQFISELVRQQMILLGPNLAITTANRTPGLEISGRGAAVAITGDPVLVLKNLLAEYIKLSPQLTTFLVRSFFTKYPDIAEEYSEPLPKSNLVCALIKPKA